ncbi:hypothetical protein KSP40_PGU009413 [Platanthera guangdongensis]|uniref:Vacuolar protein sorting 55 n=1 Tax=Platanthera guangdongensis TaxID=2320717 RepID=A0ABR2MGH3_9ASPA
MMRATRMIFPVVRLSPTRALGLCVCYLCLPKFFLDCWVDFTKFLTGASVVGSIAIPSILKHAGVICLGALMMELSSFFIFGTAIFLYLVMNREDEYSML